MGPMMMLLLSSHHRGRTSRSRTIAVHLPGWPPTRWGERWDAAAAVAAAIFLGSRSGPRAARQGRGTSWRGLRAIGRAAGPSGAAAAIAGTTAAGRRSGETPPRNRRHGYSTLRCGQSERRMWPLIMLRQKKNKPSADLKNKFLRVARGAAVSQRKMTSSQKQPSRPASLTDQRDQRALTSHFWSSSPCNPSADGVLPAGAPLPVPVLVPTPVEAGAASPLPRPPRSAASTSADIWPTPLPAGPASPAPSEFPARRTRPRTKASVEPVPSWPRPNAIRP